MKRQKNHSRYLKDDLTKIWLSEMQQILEPSKVKEKEIERRIVEHISKCYLTIDKFQTNSMFFLFNNAKLEYLFVSKSTLAVLGFSRDEIIEKGFSWLFTLFSPTELEYKKNVMNDVFYFLKTLNRKEILASTVRYDLVALRKDGKQIHLLEEMMFPEVNTAGEPLITSCFLHDIGDYVKSQKRQCNIYLEASNPQKIVFSKYYCVNEKDKAPLSRREIQILEQFSNGLTTTQVAKKLFVTENTVKTHRKNILLKLDVQNTAEAVKVSVKNKWLA